MAVTTVQTNNKLVKHTPEINREWVRGNAFSPYQGTSVNAIIRIKNELKSGGEQMNIPLVRRLTGRGKGSVLSSATRRRSTTTVCACGSIGRATRLPSTKAEQHKDSADIFGEAKPLLSDWLNELKRDELIAALMALPSESSPAGLNSDDGDRERPSL